MMPVLVKGYWLFGEGLFFCPGPSPYNTAYSAVYGHINGEGLPVKSRPSPKRLGTFPEIIEYYPKKVV